MKIYQSSAEGGPPIYVGEEAREQLITLTEDLAPDRLFIVTDRTLEALHLEEVRENLPSNLEVEVVTFNEGEENKNLGTLQHVAGDLLRAGVTDRSLVLNFGGGVVLDMGGLAASLLGRGIRFAHVATSLTAQGDVIGSGRQALNFVGRKNALGLYRSPEFCIADSYFLDTEPEPQRLAALSDFARLALVAGGRVYERAMKTLAQAGAHLPPALGATAESYLEATLEARGLKAAEPCFEAREAYGMELARAIEVLAEGRLLPGEARLYAMRTTAEIARALGRMNDEEHARHEELLERVRIATPFPAHIRTERIIYQLHGNNKTQLGGVELMLLQSAGRVSGSEEQSPFEGRVYVDDEIIGGAIEKVRAHAVL